MYSVSGSVQSYLNLKTTNADLMQRIAVLEEEKQVYKKELENLSGLNQAKLINVGIDRNIYHYTPARVTYKQVSGINNYIVLNKGSKDGITEDMAVVSANGIVGVVTLVTSSFSRVLPVINSSYNPSCMIKNTRFTGPLFWDGKDPRFVHLSGLPGHASFTIGDTIVTSGNSATFPEGVFVGVVEEDAFKRKNEDYNSLKVRLFTDFSTLSIVHIIQNSLREEQIKIERGVKEK